MVEIDVKDKQWSLANIKASKWQSNPVVCTTIKPQIVEIKNEVNLWHLLGPLLRIVKRKRINFGPEKFLESENNRTIFANIQLLILIIFLKIWQFNFADFSNNEEHECVRSKVGRVGGGIDPLMYEIKSLRPLKQRPITITDPCHGLRIWCLL